METLPHRIIFSGKLREGYENEQVRSALKEQLKWPEKLLGQLFDGSSHIIKRTASVDEARKLVTQLASLGLITRIQTTKETSDASSQATLNSSQALPRFSPYPKGRQLSLAFFGAATVELLLLALYLLLLLGFSFGLLYQSLFTTWASSLTGFGPLALLIQALALVVGLVVLFFIAKPLLSLKPHRHRGIVISDDQEPDLFAFIEDICERIDCPMPKQIRLSNHTRVDMDYLGLAGFFRNQCSLTVGVHIVASTSASQLAALIAQSLLLFHSKSLPARAAYLLRQSDAWQQRAIYDTDAIDRELKNLIDEGKSLATPAAWIQYLTTQSRRLFSWRLAMTRHINRRLIHRLVADADKTALVFCGTTGFHHLLENQRLLTYATQNMLPNLKQRWREEGSLPNDMVQALLLHCRSYPKTLHEKLRQKQVRRKALSLDTIPADSQRLRRVSKHKVQAAYPCASPATGLLQHFSKLARRMTLRLYHVNLGIPINPARLGSALAPGKREKLQLHQIEAILPGLFSPLVPLNLREVMNQANDYASAKTLHHEAMEKIEAAQSHAELALVRYQEAEQALLDIFTQETIYRAELWKQWKIPAESKSDLELTRLACLEQEEELEKDLQGLQQQLDPFVQRIATCLAMVNYAPGGSLPNEESLMDEVHQLVALLGRLDNANKSLRQLHVHVTLLQILLSFEGMNTGKLTEQITEQATTAQNLVTAIASSFKTTRFPLSNKHDSLFDYLMQHTNDEESPNGSCDRGYDLVHNSIVLQRQLTARLCAICVHVEHVLGL